MNYVESNFLNCQQIREFFSYRRMCLNYRRVEILVSKNSICINRSELSACMILIIFERKHEFAKITTN